MVLKEVKSIFISGVPTRTWYTTVSIQARRDLGMTHIGQIEFH